MKKLFVLLFLLCSISVFAQDVIVKKDGSTVVCRVVELTSSEIVYKRWADLNGSNYVMSRSDASAINYENGKKVDLAEVVNLYAPGNQNDGVQQLNDNALLKMDYESKGVLKKAKALKIIGAIGGIVLVGAGGIMMLTAPNDEGYDTQMILGSVFMGCGVVGASVLFLKAHSYQKQVKRFQSYTIYEQELKFKNGTSLIPEVELFKDLASNNHAIGVGLQYKF